MSTTAPEVDEQLLEGETDVLELQHENAIIQEGSVQRLPNGKGVDAIVTLIEEGFGNERDSHYYGEDALREALPLFNTGRSKSYINHLTPAQRQAMRGMPRSPKEYAARILEGSAHMGIGPHGRPAVKAKIRIANPLIAYIVEADPQALGLSIDARGKAEDKLVEGRSARNVVRMTRVLSTDFVTEAGANGQIDDLLSSGDPMMVEAFVEAQSELKGAGMEDQVLAGAADELREEDAPEASADDAGWEPVTEADDEMSDEDIAEAELDADAFYEADDPEVDDPFYEAEDLEEGEYDDDLEEARAELEDDLEEASHRRSRHHQLAEHHRREAGRHRRAGRRREAEHHEERARHHRARAREHRIREADLEAELTEYGSEGVPGAFASPHELEHADRNRQDARGALHAGEPYNDAMNRGARRFATHQDEPPASEHAGRYGDDHRHEIPEEPATARHLHSHTRGRHRHRGRDSGRGVGHMTEAQELAEQMVDERLDEALAAGLQTQREAFASQLDDIQESHAREVTQIHQGYKVAALIEGYRGKDRKPLPVGAQRNLKQQFFEQLFEAELGEDGQTVVKAAEQVLQEAVSDAIRSKTGELTEFREAQVSGVGPTAGETFQEGSKPAKARRPGGRRPRGRALDDQVNKRIGI